MTTTEADSPALVRELLSSVQHTEECRLEFGEEIARGGAGAVCELRDRALQRRVAAKVLLEQNATDAVFVHGFLREAQVTAQLDHPNIVPIHELGMKDGLPFFSMSLVEGQVLTDWLAATKRMDYQRVVEFLEIAIKVCDALHFAHSRGVVHCDLKPDNIMVGEFGQVYLMDWGGAQLSDTGLAEDGEDGRVRETLPALPAAMTDGSVYGTPEYMAPERARHGIGDVRTDVFAIGAILYEFLTGRAPFDAEDLAASVTAACKGAFPPLDETAHGDNVPRGLYQIVRRALVPDPDLRHQSVAELREDLAQIVRGGGDFPTVQVLAGEQIILEGDEGDAAYVIVSGELEVHREVDGERLELRRLGPGEVFGETAIFADSPRTASVAAVTDATLVRITEQEMLRELGRMKPWMATFVRTLAKRFQERETASPPTGPSQAKPSRWWWRRS